MRCFHLKETPNMFWNATNGTVVHRSMYSDVYLGHDCVHPSDEQIHEHFGRYKLEKYTKNVFAWRINMTTCILMPPRPCTTYDCDEYNGNKWRGEGGRFDLWTRTFLNSEGYFHLSDQYEE